MKIFPVKIQSTWLKELQLKQMEIKKVAKLAAKSMDDLINKK
jgi:hypothetical protein